MHTGKKNIYKFVSVCINFSISVICPELLTHMSQLCTDVFNIPFSQHNKQNKLTEQAEKFDSWWVINAKNIF